MLPGFRFLFAAIVMCMSVLVFGLGAAALLRAAHEDFASNPSWRTPPEPRFAQQDEATKTVLAVLSVQPAATEPAAAKVADAPAMTAALASPSPEPETTAALTRPEESPPKDAKPAAEAPDQNPAQVETPVPSEPTPARAEAQAEAPASAGQTKIAAVGKTVIESPENVSPSASAPASSSTLQPSPTPQQMTALAPPNAGQSATRIATLGGPAVTIEKTKTTTAAKSPDATLDRSLINKRLQAERAQERHRLAMRRARLARQAAVSQQQADNPFAPHPLVASPPAPAR